VTITAEDLAVIIHLSTLRKFNSLLQSAMAPNAHGWLTYRY